MRKIVFLFVFAISLFSLQRTFAISLKEKKLEEWGFFVGKGKAHLKEKSDYKIIPIGLRIGFKLESLLPKSLGSKVLLEFVTEPFVSLVSSPDVNFEIGTGLLLKCGYKFKKIIPFIETGTGFQYTTQHTREEATQWCFQVQGGAGFYYFFDDNRAVNFGYRYRHFSNASVKQPNKGVDVHSFYIGFSRFF